MVEAVHGVPIGADTTAVAGNIEIYPVLVDIAVKDFAPGAAAGNADAVVETVEGGEMNDHEYVVPFAFDPAVKGQDAILVAGVDDAETVSAQSRVTPAQSDQLARKTKMIGHLFVAGLEAGPMEKKIAPVGELLRPLLVFEEFLAHEKHRNPGCGQADPGGDARAAAPEPGARVVRMPKARDTLLAPLINEVVVLRTLHELPLLLNPSGHRLRASLLMFSGRISGALALPITSRMAMRNPSVSEVSKPAPPGAGCTINGFTFQYSALCSAEGRRKCSVAVRSWQKLQPWGAPS